jgi:GNAT superfamily N-acetyltransferase
MSEMIRIVTVDGSNIDQERFFCYKSKPKTEGYHQKYDWLAQRFAEGMKIKILYQGKRSFAFIEYIPGEYAWRAVAAPNYLVIHCLWVVGRGKGQGFATMLLNECEQEARAAGKLGVVMISSTGHWLVDKKVFLKNGYKEIDTAPPSFSLLVKQFKDGPLPGFPKDWDQRSTAFGEGMTITYAAQCPYMPDAITGAKELFEARGLPTKIVRFETAAEARAKSPSPYGVFGIVYNGKLFSYHYIGKKELCILDEMLAVEA